MNPTPTEYNDTVFRSKSEAMFALYLDLCMEGCPLVWKYEPSCGNEYKPDFLIYSTATETAVCKDRMLELPVTELVYVEYKPRKPTKTYIQNWVTRCENFANTHKDVLFNCHTNCNFMIYYGSVYNCSDEKPGKIRLGLKGQEIIFWKSGDEDFTRKTIKESYTVDVGVDWLSPYIQQIRDFRFDLPI